MFGVKKFEPWVGSDYGTSKAKLLVIGESRYDEDITDKQIIEEQIGGSTHTNFIQSALLKRHWEEGYDPFLFLNKVVFYNYNTTFFPGEARKKPTWDERTDPQNEKMLRNVLKKFKPTYCIVWGKENYDSIGVEGSSFSKEYKIPRLPFFHPYCSIVIDKHKTLFSYVNHPSSGYSFDKWSSVIAAFLVLKY
jgi:hypothetical protein